MKLLALALLISGCTSTSTTYCKIGVGYELHATEITWGDGSPNDSDITARFACGIEDGNISYGLFHSSQYLTGRPFNNDSEYEKTELFIDYKFTLL